MSAAAEHGADEPIDWSDPKVPEALAALRALPGGEEVYDSIGSEYLCASFLARNDLDPSTVLPLLTQTAAWRGSSGASAARERLRREGLKFTDIPHNEKVSRHLFVHESARATDKRGLPYAIRCMGMADVVGLFESVTEQEMMEWQVFVSEWRLVQLEKYAMRTGQLGDITLVQDLTSPQGLLNQWRTHRSKMHVMQTITSMMDAHYPGLIGHVLLTNAPWAVSAILQVVKPLIAQRIAQNIEVCSTERMRGLVAPSRLPKFLGGDVPDEELIPGRTAASVGASTTSYTDARDLDVAAGKAEKREFGLKKGEVAAYGFHVGGDSQQDIMFSVNYHHGSNGVSQVFHSIEPLRIKVGHGGKFVAFADGRLELVFDNQYSWMKAKSVVYECIKISAEEQGEPCSPGVTKEASDDTAPDTKRGDDAGAQPQEAPSAGEAASSSDAATEELIPAAAADLQDQQDVQEVS